MEVSGQLKAPGHFTSGDKNTRCPLNSGLGGPQSQSGKLGEEKITSTFVCTENQTPDRPARSLISVALISGFRRDVDVICGLLGDYTASWGYYI
jgi:hypothetical protein